MDYYKYPRTLHLPFSLESGGRLGDYSLLEGRTVVVTEKMDGENTSIYADRVHARSLEEARHKDIVKALAAQFQYKLGNFRVCGEDMQYKHSIFYDNLESYFLGFSAWEGDACLSWGHTLGLFKHLGVTPVPVLYTGLFNLQAFEDMFMEMDHEKQEGIVVRLADQFRMFSFHRYVFKAVRANHVQTNEHWLHSKRIQNKLIC